MRKPEEFGGKNPDNKYCVYCTDDNGILKPFDIKLKEMTGFIMKTTDLSREKAEKIALENMKKQPAWASI